MALCNIVPDLLIRQTAYGVFTLPDTDTDTDADTDEL